jgi:hypothetical protein
MQTGTDIHFLRITLRQLLRHYPTENVWRFLHEFSDRPQTASYGSKARDRCRFSTEVCAPKAPTCKLQVFHPRAYVLSGHSFHFKNNSQLRQARRYDLGNWGLLGQNPGHEVVVGRTLVYK